MLDINLLRTNPELVKENIRKKFQDEKLVMVDEVVEMDKEYRAAIQQADTLRQDRQFFGVRNRRLFRNRRIATRAFAVFDKGDFYVRRRICDGTRVGIDRRRLRPEPFGYNVAEHRDSRAAHADYFDFAVFRHIRN